MIIIAIEHCNGEIMSEPFIITDWDKIEEYKNGPYLIYKIDYFMDTIEEVN